MKRGRLHVVFFNLDPDERMRRLHAREASRREGQTFDPVAWEEFLTWASGYDDPNFSGRSLWAHEEWLAGIGLPVLTLDSAADPKALRDAVLMWEPGP